MGFAFFSPGGPPPGPGAKDYHALLEEAKGKLQQAEQEKRGRTAAAAPANRDPAGGDRGLGRGQLCALRLPEFSCEKLEGIAPYQHSRQRVSIPAANRLVSIQTEVQDGHAIGQLWKCTIAGEDTTFQTNGAGTPPPPAGVHLYSFRLPNFIGQHVSGPVVNLKAPQTLEIQVCQNVWAKCNLHHSENLSPHPVGLMGFLIIPSLVPLARGNTTTGCKITKGGVHNYGG